MSPATVGDWHWQSECQCQWLVPVLTQAAASLPAELRGSESSRSLARVPCRCHLQAVNAIDCHPHADLQVRCLQLPLLSETAHQGHSTLAPPALQTVFATAGSDGLYAFWDKDKRTRLKEMRAA